MSTYQLNLLLEALVRVHTFEELSDGQSVISLLVRHLCFTSDEAEAVVEGALHLKTIRAGSPGPTSSDVYLQ